MCPHYKGGGAGGGGWLNSTEGVTYSDVHPLRVQVLVCTSIVAWTQLQLIRSLLSFFSPGHVSVPDMINACVGVSGAGADLPGCQLPP